MRTITIASWLFATLAALVAPRLASAQPTAGEDSQHILTVDHYVPNQSIVPAIEGQTVQIYVRERVKPATIQRGAPRDDRVVLFVHGAGTPAEVAFDVPYADYSWMAYLAAAGFDVFSMDMTGYGRSTRPNVMNESCNLSAEQQTALGGTPCKATHAAQLTTIASDWDDLDAVVEYIRALRDVPRVSLVGWSLGGPRAGGYASRNPDKVAKLVLLAPAYRATRASNRRSRAPRKALRSTRNRTPTSRRTGSGRSAARISTSPLRPRRSGARCSSPIPSARRGAKACGARRTRPSWGFGKAAVERMQTPTLMVAAIHDKQVLPERVHEYFADLGAENKVLRRPRCAPHITRCGRRTICCCFARRSSG